MEQVIVKNQSEEYMVNVIRSKRKTMALQVGLDGTVVARVPNRVAKKEVLRFLDSHAAWIAAAKKKMARRQQEKQAYRSPYEIPAYDSLSKREKDEIWAHFMQRLMYYAAKIGVTNGLQSGTRKDAGEAAAVKEISISIIVCIICHRS